MWNSKGPKVQVMQGDLGGIGDEVIERLKGLKEPGTIPVIKFIDAKRGLTAEIMFSSDKKRWEQAVEKISTIAHKEFLAYWLTQKKTK